MPGDEAAYSGGGRQRPVRKWSAKALMRAGPAPGVSASDLRRHLFEDEAGAIAVGPARRPVLGPSDPRSGIPTPLSSQPWPP